MMVGDSELSRLLRAHRALQGFTQAEVARRAGTTAGYLSHIERGRRRPSSQLLLRLLKSLGIGQPRSEDFT